MTERETILGLLRLKWSVRQIERETGRRHETIARYGREAGLLPAKSRSGSKVPTDLDAPIEGESASDAVASRS
ncbi:MAG TPA: IS21 family transposase, partial [Candidatus Dormibacteraeota bacterium]|nr:IS21 family transposase [Candidatus Dormibacteraeota bacterium]